MTFEDAQSAQSALRADHGTMRVQKAYQSKILHPPAQPKPDKDKYVKEYGNQVHNAGYITQEAKSPSTAYETPPP